MSIPNPFKDVWIASPETAEECPPPPQLDASSSVRTTSSSGFIGTRIARFAAGVHIARDSVSRSRSCRNFMGNLWLRGDCCCGEPPLSRANGRLECGSSLGGDERPRRPTGILEARATGVTTPPMRTESVGSYSLAASLGDGCSSCATPSTASRRPFTSRSGRARAFPRRWLPGANAGAIDSLHGSVLEGPGLARKGIEGGPWAARGSSRSGGEESGILRTSPRPSCAFSCWPGPSGVLDSPA